MNAERQKELESIIEGLTPDEQAAFYSGVLVGTVEVVDDLMKVAQSGNIDDVRGAIAEYARAIIDLRKNMEKGENK